MRTSSATFVNYALMPALALALYNKPICATEKSDTTKDKQVSKLETKQPISEEFLMFLANFEELQGETIDPLDLLSMDLEDNHENTSLVSDGKDEDQLNSQKDASPTKETDSTPPDSESKRKENK